MEVYQPQRQMESGVPSMDELLDRYTEKVGFGPRTEKWKVAQMFHLIHVGQIQAWYNIKLTEAERNNQPWNSS
jgi:hypothetical protein